VVRANETLRFGRMYFREISSDGVAVEQAPNGTRFVRLDLSPHQFVIVQ
jgi:hypothetical protein